MKEPKEMPIIDEDEYIDCPKCGKCFKTWHANIKYQNDEPYIDTPGSKYNDHTYMNIYCPRCSYITKRRPLDWKIKE